MPIKILNPVTPSQRNMTILDYSEISKNKPTKNLLAKIKKHAGRNNNGRITVRHQGGGNKRKYRIIDFKRSNNDKVFKVLSIEYDPNRSANIALISDDICKKYIIAPHNLKVNDLIESNNNADIKCGNSLQISHIPLGSIIHNIELYPGKGAQIVRSAGTFAQLIAKENTKAQIRLPSGEVRIVSINCKATIGQVSNLDFENVKIGKAGRSRHMGIRPTVRGSAMNPCDHPHGGGEGKSPIGRPSPVTPWGKPTLGYKTRNKKHRTNKFIVKRRNKK